MRIVIIGAGEVGFNIADRLAQEQQDVIVIEKNPKRIRLIEEELDVQIIKGTGSSPRSLAQAQVTKADMVIAVTDSDEVNLTACLLAESYSRKLIKIARVRDPELASIAEMPEGFRIQLDLTINPEAVAAEKILRHIALPCATEVLGFAGDQVQLIGLRVTESSPVAGIRLMDLRARQTETPLLIAALARRGKTIIPRGDDAMEPGDTVYAVTDPSSLRGVLAAFGANPAPAERVMVFGGTTIGHLVAQGLEKRGVSCKLIEPDAERCAELAEQLQRTVVLHGEGTDEELLREENVDGVDCFVAVSRDEETNLLAALLAKSMGAKSVIASTDNSAYFSMTSRIGVDIVISPRLLAVSSILHYVRRGKVLSVAAFHDIQAEALEFVAMDHTEVVHKPLRTIRFPKGAIIGAVVRAGETIIPSGETVILPHDRVIVFALREAIPKVENALMVKLQYS